MFIADRFWASATESSVTLPPIFARETMPNSNAILAALTPGDLGALRPHLKSIFLESKTVLFNPGDVIDKVWFPEGAVVSLVVSLATGEMIEGAMVGKDGVVGVAAALDSKIALTQAVVQLPGAAF